MESEKVKEIKESLQQEIHLTEYVDREYSENVRLDLLKDVLTLINELESENERLNKSDTSKEESSIEYYNLYKDLKRKNKDLNELCELQRVSIAESFVRENQLKDRIAELEIENKSLQDLCNKTYEDLTKEIDRLEKENVKQLKQFAERLKGKLQDFGDGGEKGAYITEKDIDETLKEFVKN